MTQRRTRNAGLFLTTALTLLMTAPASVIASDHIDSPTIAQDRGSDITDTYAFLDPNDNSQVILMMGTQGFIVSGEHFGMPIFDHNIRYRFEIETTGDAIPDRFVDVYYSRGLGRQMSQAVTIELPNGQRFAAQTTISTQEYRAPAPVVTTDPVTGSRFFGGNADDPFFLDDTGANRLVASSIADPGRPRKSVFSERGGRDTYAGFNTLITAVSVPAELLRGTGTVIGVNAVTQRRRFQRVQNDGTVEVLRLDLAVPNRGPGGGTNKDGGFGKMGGRRLQDDVVDMVFTMINNGRPLGDKVNKNDVPFRNTFPFVADPHQPSRPGSRLDDGTRQ